MDASVQANIQPVVTKVTDMVIGGFYFRLFIHTDVYLSLTEGVSIFYEVGTIKMFALIHES